MKKLLLLNAIGLGVLYMASFAAPAHATPSASDFSEIWTTSPNSDPMLAPYALAKTKYLIVNPDPTSGSVTTNLDFYRYFPSQLPGYRDYYLGSGTDTFAPPPNSTGYNVVGIGGSQFGQSASTGQSYRMDYTVSGVTGFPPTYSEYHTY